MAIKQNQNKKSYRKKTQKKKKFSIKLLILFIIFEFIFTGVTAPLVIFYGPYQNVKKYIVGTSMSSFRAQFIAKTFLSKEEIHKVIDANSAQASSDTQTQNMNEIKIINRDDKKIERYDIDDEGGKYKGYLLVVNDPTRVKVGMTKHLKKKGQRTSEIAEEHNAVAAINAGGFTDKSSDGKLYVGTGGLPVGLVMSEGKILYNDMRQNDKPDMAGIDKNGHLIVGKHSVSEFKKKGIKEAIAFGPTLVVNGKAKAVAYQGLTARTAIGQRRDGAILLLVLDGRHATMLGASLKDIQKIMLENGAYSAINLDGGSSTTMYYNGEILNNPCNPFGERTIATAIYVEP